MAKITIDPVSRISGLLEIDVNIENNKMHQLTKKKI